MIETWLENYALHVIGEPVGFIVSVVVVNQGGFTDEEEGIYELAMKTRRDISSLPIEYQKSAYQHLETVITDLWQILDAKTGARKEAREANNFQI